MEGGLEERLDRMEEEVKIAQRRRRRRRYHTKCRRISCTAHCQLFKMEWKERNREEEYIE